MASHTPVVIADRMSRTRAVVAARAASLVVALLAFAYLGCRAHRDA